jgi:opacity protein-like surface antigen
MPKTAISWAALLAALPGVAMAADLPSKKAPVIPPPVFTWDGVYAGTMVGYGWANVNEAGYDPLAAGFSTLAGPAAYKQNYSSRGPQTGFHVGYLKQYGHLVLGAEADIDFATNNTAKTIYANGFNFPATGGCLPALCAPTPGGAAPFQTSIHDNWRVSLVGKAGYAEGRSLYYVLGGLVNGGYQVQHNYWGMPAAYTSFGSTTPIANNDINNIERFGWTVGAGAEYAFTDHWSANVEYRHSDFGTAHVTSTGNQYSGLNIPGNIAAPGGGIFGLKFAERSYEDSVRLGINYHFGGPVVAAAPAAAAPKGPTQIAAAAPPPPPDPSFIGRLYHAYVDEWGLDAPPADPKAPPTRRAYFPPAPVTQAPYPFTEWPFGGANPVGASYPSTIDSPLMTALAPTPVGQFLNDWHIQVYGWVNPGFNVSNTRTLPGQITGGNFPAAYAYQPNLLQLDQIVTIIERLPDTVQKDHIDWGFRLSPLYGETYRYTTANGFFSKQLQKWNEFAGYDAPMIYGELYVPQVMEGLMLRLGRYISVPDIEAQLAPNNYMYSHSMTYGYDNYTNTGLLASLQATKNWMVQAGITIGTDSMLWNARGAHNAAIPGGQLYSLFPGIWSMTPAGYLSAGTAAYNGQVDPGVKPSFTGCLRYQSDDAYNAVYSCANSINNGSYGYNNLQQYTTTFYHKFDEAWHISIEAWHMHELNTPNLASPFYGATPYPFFNLLNGPSQAICLTSLNSSCTSREWSVLTYLNWKFSPLDNISWRAEYFNDVTGNRTGFKTPYFNYAMGWQHWFTPTITIRPEIAFYNSLKTPAFGNGTQSHATIFSADLIWHY